MKAFACRDRRVSEVADTMRAYRSAGLRTKGDTMTEETTSSTYRQANEKAAKALLDVISDSVAELRSNDYTLSGQTGKVRDLAYAYRLVIGGPQPGSVEVSK